MRSKSTVAAALLIVACSRPHETPRADPPAPEASAAPSSSAASVQSAVLSASVAAAPPPAPPPPKTAHAKVVLSPLTGTSCSAMCTRAARCHLETTWSTSECMTHCAKETWAIFYCLDEARTCEQINECMDP